MDPLEEQLGRGFSVHGSPSSYQRKLPFYPGETRWMNTLSASLLKLGCLNFISFMKDQALRFDDSKQSVGFAWPSFG